MKFTLFLFCLLLMMCSTETDLINVTKCDNDSTDTIVKETKSKNDTNNITKDTINTTIADTIDINEIKKILFITRPSS